MDGNAQQPKHGLSPTYPNRDSMFEYKTFKFTAHTIDGKILEFPYSFWMRCDLVTPLYQGIVRAYDKNECIVARKVYLVSYGGHLYGTEDFTNMEDFVEYQQTNCLVKDICYLLFFGCPVTINDCLIEIDCDYCGDITETFDLVTENNSPFETEDGNILILE